MVLLAAIVRETVWITVQIDLDDDRSAHWSLIHDGINVPDYFLSVHDDVRRGPPTALREKPATWKENWPPERVRRPPSVRISIVSGTYWAVSLGVSHEKLSARHANVRKRNRVVPVAAGRSSEELLRV